MMPRHPAIDAIPKHACTIGTDQRGYARGAGQGCDIGAFEFHEEDTPKAVCNLPFFRPALPKPKCEDDNAGAH